jgi:type IV pilus assembly protein PilV
MKRGTPSQRENAMSSARPSRRHRAQRSGDRRSRGFSMIEVMIAFAILGLGLVGATTGQITAMKLAGDSRINSIAMYMAEEQLEIFRTMPSADVLALTAEPGYPADPSNPIDPYPDDGVAMAFQRRWTIQADTPEAGAILVTVEVDWTNSMGRTRTARVQALRANL